METAFCANAAPAEGQAVCLASTNARSLPQRARWPRIFPAWAAEVVSSNVVGYNKVTLTSGYNMLGSNFKLVGGENGTLTEVLDATALDGLDVDSGEFSAEILIWDGVGYDTYGWAGVVGDASMDNKWVDEGSWDAVDNVFLEIGKGCWIKSSADATLKFTK